MDTITVGDTREMVLLDWMGTGSTVANLLFNLAIHKMLLARGAHEHTIAKSQADVDACTAKAIESIEVRVQATERKIAWESVL